MVEERRGGMHILFTHTHDLNSWLAMPFIHFKTRPGIHSKRNKHSVRTHGSIPHGADEHNARASINRSQGYCWNTVAGSRLQAIVGNSSKRAAASANAASAQALTTTRCHRANADTPVRSGTTPTWVSTHSPRPPTGLHWIQVLYNEYLGT